MDNRRALTPGTELSFPGMKCILESEIGRGSNAIVYRGWYPDLLNKGQRHIVLIKELFPFHIRGAIYRNEQNAVIRGEEGLETWDLHRSSFEYGNNAHLALLERNPDQIGANLNTFELNNTLYTVLGFSGGRSLEQDYAGPAAQLRPLVVRMLGILDALEIFHESGLVHMDIAPDNILLIGRDRRERAMLIDYNSVLSSAADQRGDLVYFSTKAGYTAPEVRGHKLSSIGPASDLYSLAAVFYRCLTGSALTAFQMIRSSPPDVSDCPCLADAPDTVRSMVAQILRQGLQALPRKRYSSAADMRLALQELLDRIDGVGITHWALWEAGKRSVDRAIRENPSFAYIRDEDSLFPANARYGQDSVLPMPEYIRSLMEGRRSHALLIAPGGMGKTTAMLRAVAGQSDRYSPAGSAIAYVSLYGWKTGQTDYIRNRILETLRFKPETHSYADARHALAALMKKPIELRDETRPTLLILLDGLNEAGGDTRTLYEEINALSGYPGVCLLVSTRSDDPALSFERVSLSALTDDDVQTALNRRGLLPPEEPAMRELLRTPLMLSFFIQSAQAEGGQLYISSRKELMQAYFGAIQRKELDLLPEDTDARWQIAAAIGFVLPAIAAELTRRGRAMRDSELLSVVDKCYRMIPSRDMRKVFPQWIGHSRAIRGDASNSEEWYGEIVHSLLWKRLGLLLRGDNGSYQVTHQIISEYLEEIHAGTSRRILRGQRLRACALTAAAAAVTAFIIPRIEWSAQPETQPEPTPIVLSGPAYDKSAVEDTMTYLLACYSDADKQYAATAALIDGMLEDPEKYDSLLSVYTSSVGMLQPNIGQYALRSLNKTYTQGYVVPWSNAEIDSSAAQELVQALEDQKANCDRYISALSFARSDDALWKEKAPAFADMVRRLAEYDGRLTAVLYQLSCGPHDSGMYADNDTMLKNYRSNRESIGSLDAFLEEDAGAENLRDRADEYIMYRENQIRKMENHPVMKYYLENNP